MKSFCLKGFLIISTLFILLSSCNTIKNTSEISTEGLQSDILAESLRNYFAEKDSVQIIPNEKGNLILYLTETTISQYEPIINISFFVYDKINNEILYKNNYSRANVSWYDNKQLLLIRNLGIYDKKTHEGIKQYIIDVDTNKIKELNVNSESIK